MLLRIRVIKIIGFAILVSGLIYYQIIKGTFFSDKALTNSIRLIPQDAPRGLIYDQKGKLLVKNNLEFAVCVFSHRENKELFARIAEILETDIKGISRKFKLNFIAPFVPTEIYTTSDRDTILKLDEKNIPGVAIRIRPRRLSIYPYSISHVIGYTRKLSKEHVFLKKYGYNLQEQIGYSGIELLYDNYLRGKPGGVQMEVDSQGKLINILSEKLPKPGRSIYTTLDADLQEIAYKALGDYTGSLILMECDSGKLLTICSTPSFDLNKFTNSRQYLSKVSRDKAKPLLQRPIQGLYPIGSIFKLISSVAALEEKKITPSDKFLCTGTFHLKNAEFKCWNTHNQQDLTEALRHSCNVFFYNIGIRMGHKYLLHYAKILGLNRYTHIDLPFEEEGFLPSSEWKTRTFREIWYPGDTLNLSIGQGYLLSTPIQIAKLVNFFATGGFLVQPYIVSKIGDLDIHLRKKDFVAVNPETITIINEGLRQVIQHEEGTARILDKLKLDMAGKTGTAQVSGKQSHAWFAGFFPHKDPKYTIVVMLENSGSSFHACRTAYDFLNEAKKKKLLNIE